MFNKIITYIKQPSNILLFLDAHKIIKLTDEQYLKIVYKQRMGKKLNLKNPVSFNEKLQWLKIHDRKDIYTTMVDKYEVKKYVANIIGDEYIIPTLGIYDNWEDIEFDKFPNQFVIKCTHDSGGLVICKDKRQLDLKSARAKIERCLKNNFFYYGREWPYKNVKPRIIIEKYLKDNSNKDKCEEIRDYKIFCFEGEPKIMYISEGLENHSTASMSFFDMDFKLTDCKRKDFKQLNYKPKKPKSFEKMKSLSRILSKNLPHLRVDWYEIDGNLFFGELTFFTNSGFIPFEDEEWNNKLGKMINLDLVDKL